MRSGAEDAHVATPGSVPATAPADAHRAQGNRVQGPGQGGALDPDNGSKRWWVGAAAAVVALITLGAIGVFGYQVQQDREQQRIAAAGALATAQSMFDQLAMATNAADIRAVATEAQKSRALLDIRDGVPEIVSHADVALATLASLSDLNSETLDEWVGWRTEIERAAAKVTTEGDFLDTEAGLSAVDDVVAKGQDAIDG